MKDRPLFRIASALVLLAGFAVASCEKVSEPTPAPAPTPAPVVPSTPELTPGQKLQKRREDIAMQQIEAQIQAQENAAPAQKAE